MSWEMQTFCDIVLMSWEMPPFREDDWHDDIDDNTNRSVAAVEDTEADDGENMTNRMQEVIPDHIEWGTCPLCKDCGLLGNDCLECIEEGMRFESNPQWMFYTMDGVDHMIDISRRIICGQSLVSMVVGKVLMSTPETAVENFLHVMGEASSEPDVEHYADSRFELLKLCGMKTVVDIVARSYRLHQANCFDYINERTGETTLVAVCNTEYELFCEVGAIWLVNQHRMRPSHQQPDLTPLQRPMFQEHRRDLGATTVEADRNGSVLTTHT
jgi:hypothetical protein